MYTAKPGNDREALPPWCSMPSVKWVICFPLCLIETCSHHKCHELTASLQRGLQVKDMLEPLASLRFSSSGLTHTEVTKLDFLLETHKWKSLLQAPRELEQLSGQVCPHFSRWDIWQISFTNQYLGHLFPWVLRTFLRFTHRSLCS